jgi:hypothetical protein
MVSRVFFDLEIQGKLHSDLYTNVKQPVGGSFESSPLEVSRPVGYEGPFNYEAFREIIEQYYRSQVGASGRAINIGGGGGNIRMRNNKLVNPVVKEIEIPG